MPKTLRAIGLLGAVLSSQVSAGSITQWRTTSVERAPVLLVARVDNMRGEFRLPQGAMPWRAEIWAMIAEVTVLRSFSSAGRSILPPNSHINVRFFNYGAQRTFVNGPPPLLALVPKKRTWVGIEQTRAAELNGSAARRLMADRGES